MLPLELMTIKSDGSNVVEGREYIGVGGPIHGSDLGIEPDDGRQGGGLEPADRSSSTSISTSKASSSSPSKFARGSSSAQGKKFRKRASTHHLAALRNSIHGSTLPGLHNAEWNFSKGFVVAKSKQPSAAATPWRALRISLRLGVLTLLRLSQRLRNARTEQEARIWIWDIPSQNGGHLSHLLVTSLS